MMNPAPAAHPRRTHPFSFSFRVFSLSSFAPLRVCVRLCSALTLLALVLPSARAQRELTKIPDPDPELERRSFQVAGGFEVNLFAADPLLAKPIQMNFDAAGRLWVACSEVYPQIKPGQTANDRIVVLQDTKGVGRADKVTVFADQLLIPTGVIPGDGGAYVANSTELLHLSSSKPDGKADRRRVVLSGFGTEDTHHILHTFRWGPDGMLYFNQSIYIHSHVETPHGVRRLLGGGVWQFRPETLELDVFLHGFCNPWGHAFDRWGQSFITDGAYGEGVNYGLPGAMYVFTPGAPRIVAGLNPGSPKHCGCEITSGRQLPPEWQGNILTNDFRGHRVCRFVLSEDGAAYVSQEKPELIKTSHDAFRPVDIKMGPDGAIYIADWYNPIIQHGEVDFRDPRRDHVHGRIWRVTYKGRPLVARPRLVGASTRDVLEALKAPEDWTRQQAKRVLKERGSQEVLPALAAWVEHLDAASRNYEHDLLEGLWTYQSLDVAEPRLLARLLRARDHHARAAATRVLAHWHARVPGALELLTERVADEHPQVRLEAVRPLARFHTPQAADVALQALDRPVDKYVEYALWLTARQLEPYWMPALRRGDFDFGGNFRHLLFALQADGTGEAVKPLVELLQAGKVSADREEGVLELIATLGGPDELRLVLDRVLTSRSGEEQRLRLLTALEAATRRRGVRPAGKLNGLGVLLSDRGEPVQLLAVRLAGLWHVEALRPRLLAEARSEKASFARRQAAIDGLAHLGGKASHDALDALATRGRPLAVRLTAVAALAPLDVDAAARRAVEVLAPVPAGADAGGVFTALLQRKNGAAALTKALAGKKLPADVAKVGVRTARASGREDTTLVAALTKAGGLTNGTRVLSAAEMRRIVADVAAKGDPARGELVYRRKDQTCLKCHAIAGAGGRVGPDLVSIGASAPVDYLIESILQPNKAVKEGYHSMIVSTNDGRFITGIKVRETDKELVLRDAEDREIAVPLKAIDDRAMGGSLMPDGLADTLTRGELIDLVRFLSELGKVGPYSVSKAPVVRRWQVLEPTAKAYRLLTSTSFLSATKENGSLTWSSAYSKVDGTLPPADLPRFTFHKPDTTDVDVVGFARCQFEASARGDVRLSVNSAEGLTGWLDGVPVNVASGRVWTVQPGPHTLTLAVDLHRRRRGLRCELADAPGSAGHVQVVSGK
jgi:putative heme-binding domain-containing protein